MPDPFHLCLRVLALGDWYCSEEGTPISALRLFSLKGFSTLYPNTCLHFGVKVTQSKAHVDMFPSRNYLLG